VCLKKQNNINSTTNKIMAKNIIASDPAVFTIDHFLTIDECNHLIQISKDKMKRALVTSNTEGIVSTGRTGSNCWIPHDQDEITNNIAMRISNCIGLPLDNAESFQMIHYSETQEYRPHYDSWIHDSSEKTLRNMKYGGQRMWTALCYLNSVQKGGGTQFPVLNKTVSAECGKLLVFQNVVDGTNTRHTKSKHAGMPVEEGEKYAFNLWFREAPKKILYKTINPEYYGSIGENDNRQLTCQKGVTPQYLEEGDFIPFVKIRSVDGTTKEIHNFVDSKPFLIICTRDSSNVFRQLDQNQLCKLSFNMIIVSNIGNSSAPGIINCQSRPLTSMFEIPNTGFRIYVAEPTRKITTIYEQESLVSFEPEVPIPHHLNIPYLLVENVLSPDLLKTIHIYLEAKRGESILHSHSTKNRIHVYPCKQLEADIDNKLSRSLFPEIRKVYYHDVKYRERYKICSYDADTGGRFHAHRDTPYPYQHRKYAMSLFLNDDYKGGHFLLKEYGLRIKPKANSALIFPGICSHQVEKVTSGSRKVIISFYCSEIDGKTKDNNMYTVKSDYFKEQGVQLSSTYPF
jgi:prolyl 4-hydroxylase